MQYIVMPRRKAAYRWPIPHSKQILEVYRLVYRRFLFRQRFMSRLTTLK